MSISDNERPKFYEGEYLDAEDLTASVDYGRTQQARHALGAHTWGIAMGLQLKETPSTAGGEDVDVSVQPGYAWDGFGRPIVVLAPYKIPADKFKSFVYDRSIDDPAGRLIEIWIRYDETSYQSPKTGFEVCDVKDQYARVKETFQIEIGERPNHPDRHDPIVVAGRTTDAEKVLQAFNPASPLIYDESVPYQTFAGQDGKERWLLPLGYVRWQPNQDPNQPGRFVKRTKDDLESSRKFRHYIGVVAERIEGARGFIRMRKRIKDPALTVWSDDLVWVEGSLRVDKDARLFGGKLDFRDNVGDDEGTPLAIRRIEHNDQKGKDLQLIIGEKQDGLNRLSIGPLKKDDSLEEKVVVTDAGNVGIGTDKPGEALEIGNSGNLLLKASGDDPGDIIFQDSNSIQKGKIWSNPSPGAGLFLSSGDSNPDISIDSKGNVGIGTANPQQKLTLGSGNILLPNTNQGIDGNLYFGGITDNRETGMRLFGGLVNGKTPAGYIDVRTTDNKDGLRFRVDTDKGATERMRITADGNVGIGTDNPGAKLEVLGSDDPGGQDQADVIVTGRLRSNSSHGGGLYIDGTDRFVGGSQPGVTDGKIGFYNKGWHFLVRDNGNVGIGTPTPSVELEVNGVVKANEFMLADGSQLTGGGKCFNQILLECYGNIDVYAHDGPWADITNMNGSIQVSDNSTLLLELWFRPLLELRSFSKPPAKLRFGISLDNGITTDFRECKMEEVTWKIFYLNAFIFPDRIGLPAGPHNISIQWCIDGDPLGYAHGQWCNLCIWV